MVDEDRVPPEGPGQTSPGEDWGYLNPHSDGPVAHPSADHLPDIVLFLVPLLFVLALGLLWFLLSMHTRSLEVL